MARKGAFSGAKKRKHYVSPIQRRLLCEGWQNKFVRNVV
jgi:hypothetical protein